jgi:hypothetical protein
MQSKVRQLLLFGAAAVALFSSSPARSLNFDKWVATSPALLELTLNIAGKTHYAMRGAARSAADEVIAETAAMGSAYFANLSETGAFGHVFLFDLGSSSRVHWAETTVTQAVMELDYWRKHPFNPSSTGNFTLHGMTLRWITFTHVNAASKRFACFGYSGAGRAVQVALRGSWCAEGAASFSEAEIRGFVGAFGYKDILTPLPLRSAPGVGVPG